MENLLLLVSCLCIGVLLRARNVLPDNAARTLNGLIVNVFVPAITLRHGVDMHFSYALLLPIVAAWLVFGAAFLWFHGWQKAMGLDRATVGALILVGGISSISFVGFPIFEWLYGAEGLQAGIVMSQAGTFVICSTAGIAVVSLYGRQSQRIDWAGIGRDIARFPPFIAFLAALSLKVVGYTHPPLVGAFLEKLGAPMSVAALLSIGLQMNISFGTAESKALALGLLYKLVLSPLLVLLVFLVLFKQTNIPAKVSVVGSTLGSMNTIGIVAINKGLNPSLITKMLAISIPLSLLLVPLVYWVIERVV